MTPNELYLARDIKGNKKRFSKYIRNRRKMKRSVGALPSGKENLITDDIKKAEVFNVDFASGFTKKINGDLLHNTININNKEQAKIGKEQSKDYLNKLDVFKSARPDEIHSSVLQLAVEVH